jgi:hypothetical protein
MRCGILTSTSASGKRNFARRDCQANSTDEPSRRLVGDVGAQLEPSLGQRRLQRTVPRERL